MASSKSKMGSALSDMNIGELRVQVAKLRSELETERKLTKQLRREKSLEVKESLKREQCKNSIAFNDLKTKLRQDKVKEIDLQRSLLTKKFDAELKKVTQQKDLEISKLKSRIHPTHGGPKTRTKNSGLSDMAQSSFEAERDKMRKEIEELKATRSKLEEQLRMLTESDRQKSEELRKQEEFHKVVVSKLKREADQEVRRLLDELRCRDRCLSQMQRELNTQAAQLSQLRADKEEAQNTLDLTRQAVSWERRSPRKNSSSFIPITEEPKEPELITLKSKTTTEKNKDIKNNNEMTLVVWKDKCSALEMACEELGDLYHDLEEKCGNLEDQVRVQEETIDHLEVQTKELEKDKDDLSQQVQQAEKKQQAVLEKNKEFLKKNVRLTKDVRQLEARVRELTEETFGMKTEVDSYQRECSRLREQVNYGNLQKETLAMMQQELQLLRQQRMEQDRTIMALGLACADKDKRIELIAFKRRKQKKALVKKKMVRFLLPAKARAQAELEEENYYGYDEDSNESELSLSTQISGASLEDDSLLEDVPPYQMERNYQQLVREHLELERSYSELQTQQMYLENSEQMQTNEKVMQTKINKLQKKMEEYKQRHNQISSELFEAQEQNEILEFRLLELEETNEKLTEEIQKLQSERLTKETREMETAEPDFGHVDMNSLNMKIQVVAQKLSYMKESQEINLRPDDKTSLAQASIVLKAAVHELDSQREREEALKQIITSLEHQQRALQSASATVPPDLVQKYEWSRSQLISAHEELRQMELEVYELRKENEELLNSQQDTNIFKPVAEKSEQPDHQLLSQENKRLTDHIAVLEQKLQQVPASGVPEFTNDSCDSDSSICDSGIFERSMTESIDEMSEMDTLYEEEEDEFLRSQAEEEEKLKKQQETQHQECHTELSLLRQDLEICRRQVESREHMIENLEEKVGQVERERDRVTERLGQLEEIKKHLEDEVNSLKWVQEENRELQTLKAHLEEAENIKLQLQERISELQVLTEEETNRSLNLEEQIQSLEDSNENFQTKLKSAKQENQNVKQELTDALFAKDEEYEHKIRSLKRAESELLTTIKQLKWKLQDSQDKEIQVRDQLALVTEEKQRRIQSLERQVDCMAENESLLNETIISLEDKEGDLKQKVQTMEKYKTKCNNVSTEMDKVKEENKRLSERVKELAARESDLLEQVYKSNLDNQELQDHIDELIAQSEGADSDGNSTGKDNEQWQLADLQRSFAVLEKENKELKDNLLQAKLALINSVEDASLLEGDAATMAQLGQKLAEAEKTEQQLKDEKKSITEKKQKLEAKLSKLEKKIDFLNKNEQKLYEQLDIMEEDNAKLRDQLESAEKESHKDKLEQQIKSHEKKEEDLKQTIALLQEEKQAAEMKLVSQIQNQAEIEGLQEKVDTFMEAQEHLMDKLAEKELTETQLRATITDLTEKCQYDSHQKIAEMECTEKELKNELNEWEKMCKEYREKVRELEKEIAQYKSNESEHEDIEISHMRKVKSLEGSVFNLQVAESEFKIKITQLETENMRLAELLREAKAAKSFHETFTTDSGNITMCSDDLLKTDETETFNYREALTKVELLAKVHEMERLDELNKARIIDLEDNLEKLREALQHEAVTIEVDTDIPMLHHRPETKDTEYEARVQSLVKTEISSRLKVFEVQKENIELRAELEKRVQAEAIQEQEHKVQQDLQLCELDRLRKSEASLKEMLEYSNLGRDGEEAEKIRHLEVQVADLEMSELKHKQRIEELKIALKSLEQKVQAEDKDVLNKSPLAMALKDIKDKEVYYKMVEEISVLEESDSELKNKLTDLDKADKLRLLERIAELERVEKGLIRKVELLENQEVPATPMCENPAALDSPEAIMRQRIYDLEKVERQLKQQMIELEKDREELHEMTRKDKCTIHNLRVELREYELRERNLKRQLSQSDARIRALTLTIDDLLNDFDTREAKLQQILSTEKEIRDKYSKTKQNEIELIYKLETANVESKYKHGKLQKQISGLQKEKIELADRVDELAVQVDDLAVNESSLVETIKDNEDCGFSLQCKMAELEQTEKQAQDRIQELEKINEQMSQQIQDLEEDKSSMKFEIGSLKAQQEEDQRLLEQGKKSMEELKMKMDDLASSEANLQARAEALAQKEVEVAGKLKESEEREHGLLDKISAFDENEHKLKNIIQGLEANVVTAESQVSISKEAEQENTSLHQKLGRCQDEICELERERQDLKDRLELYEYSHANKELATVPRSELTQLRAQVKLLEEAETNVTRLQKSEQNLAGTVKKLRQGMDVCGHEVELEELQSKLDTQSNVLKEKEGLQRALNSTKKAYEILKENNDEVKGQLKKLHGEIQNGNISVRVHGLSGLSYNKGVQCCLTDIITIRGGTKEFQAALKRLGTEHPDAYHVFLRALLKKTSESPAGGATMRVSTEEVHEDLILPHLKIKPGSETARAYHPGDRKTVLDDLVSHLPTEDEAAASSSTQHSQHRVTFVTNTPGEDMDDESGVEELKIVPKRKGTQKKTDTATHTETEHSQMIDSLVTLLPSGDIACLLTEEDYWAQIEGKPADRLGSVLSDVYWKEIEGDKSNSGLALAVNFSEDTDGSQSDSSTGGSHKPIRPLSSTSLLSFSSEGSSVPPPLPMSQPPPTVTEETMETMDNHDDKPDSSFPVLYSKLEKSPKHTAVSVGDHTACIAEINRLKDLIKDKEQELTKAKNREQEMTKQMLDMGDAKVLSGQLENEKARAQELEAKVADLLVETTQCKTQISSLQTKADQTEKSSKAAENLDQALKDMEGNALVQKIQLERKDRELAAKVNESDHLTSELRHCQENCQRLKEEKQRIEEMLRSCQQTIDELTDINNKYQELQKQYAMLKQQHADLSNNHQALESDVEDKKSLETIILKLQGQLKDMERLELEHQDLQARQEHTKETLNKKVQSESKLTKENISLQHDLDQCQRENIKYKEMEKEYNHIQSKFDEMVQIKLKSQSSVAPLRAKVIKLSHKCREKDALIKCLASELRQTGKPSDLLAETDRVEAQSASEEYNRPVSPLFHSTPNDPKLFSSGLPEELPHKVSQPSRIPRWVSSHDSTDDLPLEHEVAPVQHTLVDTDYRKRSKSAGSTDWGSLEEHQLTPGHTTRLSRPSSTLPNNQRSRSAEAKVPKLQTLKNLSSVSNCYRAVKDYDPTLYSQSGRQELEIPLTEGDTVRLLGPADGSGYCEADVHGRVGLVPHGYLQPVQPGTPLRLHRQQHHHVKPSSKRVTSRDQVLAMPPRDDIRQHPSVHLDAFSFVGLAGVGSHGSSSLTGGSRSLSDTAPGAPVSRPSSVPAQRQTTPTSLSSVHSHPHLGESLTGRPAPPDHFCVERVLGRQSILLTWQPPTVDKQMRSNGAKVKGYKIYINHQEKQTIANLHLTKAIVQRLDLHRRNQFSIQTLATDGQTSPMVHTVMDAVPTSAESVSDRDVQVDSDMSSVLSSALLDDGDRRVFMAVYDYNPAEHSPHDFTASELALNTGDIVVTYGSERPDGFYHGKVHGRKGLVPASFIEEVALLRPKRKKVAVTSSTTSSLQRPSSRSSSRLSGESMQPGNLHTTSHHQS